MERAGADMTQAIDALARWRSNIHLVSQMIQNDVSSTKVRLFLRRGMSVRYLIPTSVMDYIIENGLYQDEGSNSTNSDYRHQLYRERERAKAPLPNSNPESGNMDESSS